MATSKKYNEFPAGTFNASKIFLQADATTGELEKIPMPTLNDFNTPAYNTFIDLNGMAYQLDASTYMTFNSRQAGKGSTLQILPNYFRLTSDNEVNEQYASIQALTTYPGAKIVLQLNDGPADFTSTIEIKANTLTIKSVNGNTGEKTEIILSSGFIKLSYNGIQYANNAAAIAAGVPQNALYRNGDNLCIVH